MTSPPKQRGGAPVGHLSDLDPLETTSVLCLRLWSPDGDTKDRIRDDLLSARGPQEADKALKSLENICDLCARFGRRTLMRHAPDCACLGADECCFANFIATAAEGAREDALLMAMLLVRADMAPVLTAMATDFGLALKRHSLTAPLPHNPLHAAGMLH